MLFWLSLAGALGQMSIFYTIANFGALTCSLITTMRKMMQIGLSALAFGHTFTPLQIVGIASSFAGVCVASLFVRARARVCVRASAPAIHTHFRVLIGLSACWLLNMTDKRRKKTPSQVGARARAPHPHPTHKRGDKQLSSLSCVDWPCGLSLSLSLSLSVSVQVGADTRLKHGVKQPNYDDNFLAATRSSV